MSEIAINAPPEAIIVGGFVVGLILAWVGTGIRVVFSLFGKGDPEI